MRRCAAWFEGYFFAVNDCTTSSSGGSSHSLGKKSSQHLNAITIATRCTHSVGSHHLMKRGRVGCNVWLSVCSEAAKKVKRGVSECLQWYVRGAARIVLANRYPHRQLLHSSTIYATRPVHPFWSLPPPQYSHRRSQVARCDVEGREDAW